ncbi:MAG: GIY-YIG nuclease family protein [Parcubacteria group bacterium]
MFFVYVLKSLKDGNLYIGRTNNVYRRFREHSRGAVPSTRSRRPFILAKVISVDTELESVKLEKELKKGYKREELKKELGEVA